MKQGVEQTMQDVSGLDKQIETLMDCKPLSETEVKQLCEKVSLPSILPIFLLIPPSPSSVLSLSRQKKS
jgi:hypothetical protein